MKRAYFLVMVPMLLTTIQIMSNPILVAEKTIATSAQISVIAKKEAGAPILAHGVSPIFAHGVSPLGTSSPYKKSQQEGRVKRAISAFDLATKDELADLQ